MDRYLYRALNEEEISRGTILPKSIGDFLMPATPPLPVPFPLGETEFMAMFKHQYGEHYGTSGISVTSDKNIAINKYGQNSGVVVKLCSERLQEQGVKVLTLENELVKHLIRYPEDKESILVCTELPSSCVIEITCSNANKSKNMDKFEHAFASLQHT